MGDCVVRVIMVLSKKTIVSGILMTSERGAGGEASAADCAATGDSSGDTVWRRDAVHEAQF